MVDELIKYGFSKKESGWLIYEKNGWTFDFNPDENYIWLYPPHCSDDEGICLQTLTYEKTIKLIEFITDYE